MVVAIKLCFSNEKSLKFQQFDPLICVRCYRTVRTDQISEVVSVYYLWLFNLLLVHDLTFSIPPPQRDGVGARMRQGFRSDQQVRINTFRRTATRSGGNITSFVDVATHVRNGETFLH